MGERQETFDDLAAAEPLWKIRLTNRAEYRYVRARCQLKEELKTTHFLTTGFDFCQHCQRITKKVDNGCCYCGSTRIKFNKGIIE